MGLTKDCGIDLHAKWPKGTYNKITDVPGVKVAHVTIQDGDINTGVTAILPHTGNMFRDKVAAGAAVINGFGKSTGLIQIKELGNIETPIIMTNTLSVGTAQDALVRYMLRQNADIGTTSGTVNCVVTECNDGRLNDIRGLHVKDKDVFEALDKAERADADFEEGAVGSGTGMCCLGFKGGIGSSSRLIRLDDQDYVLGSLVMTNFGEAGNLVVGSDRVGARTKEELQSRMTRDKGSIIMIIATDIPMTARQLERTARRGAISLGRTGSYMANGSGDIAIAFSTANRMPHDRKSAFVDVKALFEDDIDKVFEATAESIEESIISSLYHAKTTRGVRGSVYYSLREFIEK